MTKCKKCYHYFDGSGVYGQSCYCKLGHQFREKSCLDFIDENDKKSQYIYNIEIAIDSLEKRLKRVFKEEMRTIKFYLKRLKKVE